MVALISFPSSAGLSGFVGPVIPHGTSRHISEKFWFSLHRKRSRWINVLLSINMHITRHAQMANKKTLNSKVYLYLIININHIELIEYGVNM